MPEALAYVAAAATHPGWKYRNNQDAVLLGSEVWQGRSIHTASCSAALLVGVADGAAFAPCASRASRMVLELLARDVADHGILRPSAPRTIQQQMARRAAGTPCEGMASTLAAIHFTPAGARIVSVGDSRVYLCRGGELRQLTVDHTVARRMVAEGDMTQEQATQAGSLYEGLDSALFASAFEDVFEVFSNLVEVEPGDRWLCCSDGITQALADAYIAKCLATAARDVATCVREIIRAAKLVRSSDDNLSVIVVQVEKAGRPATRQRRQRSA